MEIGTDIPDIIPVRDSKNTEGPVLVFSRAVFSTFVSGARTAAHPTA
ncbi:DUF397 domain-containing protein [Streptomyces scopuliridis]